MCIAYISMPPEDEPPADSDSTEHALPPHTNFFFMGETPDPDRPNGMLTRRDRRWLLGLSEVEAQSQTERNIRAAIRERLKNGLLDFELLYNTLEPRDRKHVFDSISTDMEISLAALLAFVYRDTRDTSPHFQKLLESAIKRVETETLYNTDHYPAGFDVVDVNFEVVFNTPPENPIERIGSIEKKLRHGYIQDLTDEEIRMFFQYYEYADEFDPGIPARVMHDLSKGIHEATRPRDELPPDDTSLEYLKVLLKDNEITLDRYTELVQEITENDDSDE